MEKIAIISDIHGNITALNAALADISKRGITRIFCLGDLVIKCPEPDLVVDVVREKCEVVVKGNCDDIVVNNCTIPIQFWTREKLGVDRLKYLDNLPVSHDFYMSGYLIRLFHASPFNLEDIYNPMYKNEGRYKDFELPAPELLFMNTPFISKTDKDPIPDIVGYGHLHTPNLFRFRNKTIFNPGSLGVPMELSNIDKADPNTHFSTLASYIILEGEFNSKTLSSISFNLVRLPYDVEKEVNFLNMSDIPNKENTISKLRTATY
ncbi:MAG: metallophosphatase family protein [Firmicutes bacterium]|nr:metallophosphatase family protein [Bacillota bacterium]